MLNEIEEFKAYTTFPEYTVKSKRDRGFLGRFTFDMLKKFDALTRVFSILARGYMWESDEPDVDCAYRALCAWCSLPEEIHPKRIKAGQDKTCFPELHREFPELVTDIGEGWFYRHIHSVIDCVNDNFDLVSNTTKDSVIVLEDGFDKAWCDRLMQYQASLYSKNTKGWVRRFDDIIADAKETGRLLNKDFDLPEETEKKFCKIMESDKRNDVLITLAKYYIANKPADSEWVILPVDNFNAYFGTTSFDRKWLPTFPYEIIVREEYAGICRFKMFV